jgi:hypothetical protein
MPEIAPMRRMLTATLLFVFALALAACTGCPSCGG